MFGAVVSKALSLAQAAMEMVLGGLRGKDWTQCPEVLYKTAVKYLKPSLA